MITSLAILILLAAFLAGGYAYKFGLFADIKKFLINPTPQPTKSIPVIQPDFSFEFLDDPTLVSLNNKPFASDETSLKFIVAGHVYGKPGEENFHPAPSLVNNIALLKTMDADFMVSLGDMVWRPTAENFKLLKLLILDPYEIPVFNAVGNHDVTKRDIYQDTFGSTVFAFEYKKQLFIFLDTTLQYYNLTPDEYSFIMDVIYNHLSEVQFIHIFMHHVLFLDKEEIYSKPLLKPNEGDGSSKNFLNFIQSDLVDISNKVPIYIYAGDVGAFSGSNLSPLYKKNQSGNITFLATGLGGNQSDSILIVEHTPEQLLIQPFSLTGRDMGKIEDYSLENWSKR